MTSQDTKQTIKQAIKLKRDPNIPCINCILLPICISKCKKHINKGYAYLFLILLGNECQLIINYVYSNIKKRNKQGRFVLQKQQRTESHNRLQHLLYYFQSITDI